MKIKLIAEGSTKWERFIKRWGIAFLIGEDVLFDTFGDARVFLQNVKKFKVDLSKVRHVVISHDHWDHIAGLGPILQKHKNLTVYIGANFSPSFKEKIRASAMNVVEVKKSIMITDGVFSTGQILGKFMGDDIYEQSIVIKSGEALSLITGCAHPNIVEIVTEVKNKFGKVPHVVIGGLHLKEKSIGRVQGIIEVLKDAGVSQIAPLHCSGKNAKEQAREQFREQYLNIREGDTITL